MTAEQFFFVGLLGKTQIEPAFDFLGDDIFWMAATSPFSVLVAFPFVRLLPASHEPHRETGLQLLTRISLKGLKKAKPGLPAEAGRNAVLDCRQNRLGLQTGLCPHVLRPGYNFFSCLCAVSALRTALGATSASLW